MCTARKCSEPSVLCLKVVNFPDWLGANFFHLRLFDKPQGQESAAQATNGEASSHLSSLVFTPPMSRQWPQPRNPKFFFSLAYRDSSENSGQAASWSVTVTIWFLTIQLESIHLESGPIQHGNTPYILNPYLYNIDVNGVLIRVLGKGLDLLKDLRET